MFIVYIIYSPKFDRYYVGMSSNFKERLSTHNAGVVKSTKAYVPWELFHLEEHDSRLGARKREKYLKSAAGRRWRKNNLGM